MELTNYTPTTTTRWIEQLALDEINMEEEQVISLGDHVNPVHLLEESSINFVDHLRDLFELYVNKFNDYRGQTGQVKIFKISGTVNDFMLFRNSLRLIVARKANDVITIGFITPEGTLRSARLANCPEADNAPHEIVAHLGPFYNISWKFMGEDVDAEAMVRHYLTEFLRKSSR